MEVDNATEISESTVVANPEADTQSTVDNTISKNGSAMGSPNNGVLSTGGIGDANLTSPNTATNGIRLSYKIDDYVPPSSKSTHDLRNTFSWEEMLKQTDFTAAPVSAFRHAPMSDCWENIIVGMKVRRGRT